MAMSESGAGSLAPVPQGTESQRIKLNVGGKEFETASTTLYRAGDDSLLAAFSAGNPDDPIFVDRDPEIFSALLSFLRSGRLPFSARRRFSNQELAEEALYYGMERRLRPALSPPSLIGISASLVATLVPAAEAHPTALHAGSHDGSLWMAHGGQISSYDPNLSHSATVRTHLDEISALQRFWQEIAAIGSLETPGLHLYDVSTGRQVASISWSDSSDPRVYKARVTAIAAAVEGSAPLFAAFECPHRENCILSVDRSTLQIVSEIGRQSGSGTRSSSPRKLLDLSETGGGLLFALSVSSGAFGYSGYMRLWDPRAGKVVWETSEPGAGARNLRFGDALSDADADGKEMAIYKVCWKSGDLAVADMRKLSEDPWFYLEDRCGAARPKTIGGGANSMVNCYNGQVFVSRENGLQVWSRAEEKAEEEEESGDQRRKKIWMSNFVDGEDDARRGLIRGIESGGDRLFVSRAGMEGVEVWESSDHSRQLSSL